jgi:hypothetical protein
MNLFKVDWDDIYESDVGKEGDEENIRFVYVKAENPRHAAEIVCAALEKTEGYAERMDDLDDFRVHRIPHEEVEGAGIVEMRFVIPVFATSLRKKEGVE